LKPTSVSAFRKRLTDWYRLVRRDLPWRRTSNPFHIWISEIMLQQTRVAAVIPFYEKFLKRFPDIRALASAPEQEVLAHWAGLGYYSRARNLQRAAQAMAAGTGGFPAEYDAIRELPGIGDYTAAAVASIAFGKPHAVVDGNVLRVLSRLTNDASDIASPRIRKRLTEVAQRLLDPAHPGDYNQAMMELGATVCTPKSPSCQQCPVRDWCEAYRAGTQNQLPVKVRSQKKAEVDLMLLLIERTGRILMRQRPETSGQMPGFWELPVRGDCKSARIIRQVGTFNHQITFTTYRCEVAVASVRSETIRGYEWVDFRRLSSLPLTTTTQKALRLQYPL
jgi:A/G-specific adenine glycosylase